MLHLQNLSTYVQWNDELIVKKDPAYKQADNRYKFNSVKTIKADRMFKAENDEFSWKSGQRFKFAQIVGVMTPN